MASISWRLVKQLEPGAVCLRALCNISVTKEAGSASWANISGLAACLRLHNPLSYYCCCYINQMLHIIKQQPEHGQAKLLILWAGLSPRGGFLGENRFHVFTSGLRWAWLNPQTTRTSPAVWRLVSELRGHQGKVLPHPEPQVGFGDAAVVRVDGVDTGHLPGYQSEWKHRNTNEGLQRGKKCYLPTRSMKTPP